LNTSDDFPETRTRKINPKFDHISKCANSKSKEIFFNEISDVFKILDENLKYRYDDIAKIN
jgi:hypothetical protein